MKCPHCKIETLTALHVGGTRAHVCKRCHGIWFKRSELETLKDHLEERSWFDVSLWEERTLMSAKRSTLHCPECEVPLARVDWKEGELVADICPSCGGMWLPKGEYQKAARYLKESADDAVMEHFGGVLAHEIEQALSGEKDAAAEFRDLSSLLSFFRYRFIAKHPVLTEVIEELPFTT